MSQIQYAYIHTYLWSKTSHLSGCIHVGKRRSDVSWKINFFPSRKFCTWTSKRFPGCWMLDGLCWMLYDALGITLVPLLSLKPCWPLNSAKPLPSSARLCSDPSRLAQPAEEVSRTKCSRSSDPSPRRPLSTVSGSWDGPRLKSMEPAPLRPE